jgi:minor tail protein Z (GPZ)
MVRRPGGRRDVISISVSNNINKLLSLDKQLVFAAAKSLTQIAKEGQTAAIEGIKSELTIRSEWYLPSRRFGVRIKTATKTDLSSEVKSAADWLAKLATGETHTPTGGRSTIAVPTSVLQPTGREIIPRALRPRQLKNAFVIKTTDGRQLLVKRVGPRPRDLKVYYVLEPKTRRPKKNPLTKAVERTVTQRFGPVFAENFKQAIATAR